VSLPGPASTRRRSIARSGVSVAVGTALSRVTGVIRLAALAYALGRGVFSDAYNAANTTPNVLFELAVGGVLTATLVPVFVEHLDDDDHDAVSAVATVTAVVLAVITVLGIVAAPAIVAVITDDPDQRDIASQLLRLFMPQVLFYGLAAIGGAVLNARRSFAAPALAPVLNNVVVSAMFFALPHLFEADPIGDVAGAADDRGYLRFLGLGTTLGVAIAALALIPSLRRVGVRIRPLLDWRHPAVVSVIRMSGWTVGYVVANQIALMVVYRLALHDGDGNLTAYQLAFTFFQLPHGLIAVTVMTMHGPVLARMAVADDWPRFRARFASGLRILTFLVCPAAAGLIALHRPTISAVLEHGNFGVADTATTASTLAWFACGLVGFSVYLYTLRAFYAMRDTRTPFWLNVVENALNIALAVPLVRAMGVEGLALAYAIAYTVSAVMALVALGRAVGPVVRPSIVGVVIRVIGAAAVMGEVVGVVTRRFGSDHGAGALARLVVGIPLGTATYLVLLAFSRPRPRSKVYQDDRGHQPHPHRPHPHRH
jgi:putative peptidoglycan lipid II flippase